MFSSGTAWARRQVTSFRLGPLSHASQSVTCRWRQPKAAARDQSWAPGVVARARRLAVFAYE